MTYFRTFQGLSEENHEPFESATSKTVANTIPQVAFASEPPPPSTLSEYACKAKHRNVRRHVKDD